MAGIFAAGLGTYAYIHAFKLILPITAGIGAFMILRGTAFFIGAFTQFQSPGPMVYFYYVLAYVLLFVFGYAFQKHRGYDSENQDDKEDQASLEGDADDQFKKAAAVIVGSGPQKPPTAEGNNFSIQQPN